MPSVSSALAAVANLKTSLKKSMAGLGARTAWNRWVSCSLQLGSLSNRLQNGRKRYGQVQRTKKLGRHDWRKCDRSKKHCARTQAGRSHTARVSRPWTG